MLIIYFSGIWSRKGAPAELLSAWRGRRFLFFYLCMEPRLTPEQIERFAKVDRGEEFGPAVSPQLLVTKIENELEYLQALQPVAVITGSYLTIPVTCQILKIPLAWVIQSTWLKDFLRRGAG